MSAKLPEKHHIAIFVPSMRGGGAERVMLTLANALAQRGHCVDLVLAKAEGPYLPDLSDKVRLVDLNVPRVLRALWPLVHYLRRERPEAMLSALNYANIIAILARKIAKVPVRLVASEHTSLAGLEDKWRGALLRALMRGFYPMADLVVSVSRDGAKELVEKLGLPAALVTSIPNPVPVDKIAARAALRPEHPWLAQGSPPIVLAVGRLEAPKDYPNLLRAFALLRQDHDLRLVILGEGSLRPLLEQQIEALGLSGSVALLGFQPNPFGWMAACALYVMSSRYEGLPTSLIEAMACGARIVCTDCPTGPAEILQDGQWGRLVPVGDAKALARAMAETLQDAAPPDVITRAKVFDSDSCVRQYEERALFPMGAI